MADRYWVGGTGTWNTTSTTNWSASSGGASGASVPTVADNVFFDQAGTYTVTMTGALACLDITVSAGTVTFATGTTPTLDVRGSMTLAAATAWNSTGAITFTSTSTGRTITTNGVTLFGAVTFSGVGGGWTLGSALTVSNNSGISFLAGTFDTSAANNYSVTTTGIFGSSGTSAKTINLNASTVTISVQSGTAFNVPAGTTNLTFNAGTSQINLSAPAGSGISSIGLVFYNVAFTGTTVGFFKAITGVNTFNNLAVTGPSTAGVTTVTFAAQQTINGTLSTTGTAGNRRVWFAGATYGIAQTLTINSAPSLTDADFRDIYVVGTAAPISGTRIGNRGACRGITFSAPKTVYWNLAGAQNWRADGWTDTSTGTPNTNFFPLPQDTATFTNAGSVTGTITLDSAIAYCPNVDMSGRTSAMTLGTSNATTVYGNWTNGSGTAFTGTATLTFSGGGTQTITSAGKTFSGPITVDTYGGTVQLADALNIGSNTLTVTNGTFTTNGFTCNIGGLSSSNTNVRSINLGASSVLVSNTTFSLTTITNLTFNAGTSTINFNNAVQATFSSGGLTFYNVIYSGVNGNIILQILGANTFNNLTLGVSGNSQPFAYSFSANQIINGTLTCAGTSAVRRIFLQSSTIGTQRTLTVNSISATDCDFRDINLAGAASGASPTRAGDCGGNTGITFPAPKTVYWNLAGAQNWSATGWATSSGGSPAVNNFPLAQDTAVFDNTGSVTGTITINAAWNIGTFDASARTSAMTLTTSTTSSPVIYGDWKFGTGVTSSITTGVITFAKNGTQTITSNGVQFGCTVTINHPSGTVQLADAISLNTARTLTLAAGTFDAVTYNVTTGTFTNSVSTNVIKMGAGTWTLSGTGSVWLLTATPTIIAGTSTIVLSSTSTASRIFSSSSLYYNKLTIGGATGTSTTTISGGSNVFGELASTKTVAHTLVLFSSTTTTVGKWSITGTAGNVVTVSPDLAATAYTLSIAGPATSGIDYLSISYCTVSPTSPGEFYVGANSVNVAGNTRVIFTATPTPRTLYWRGGTGNWSATTSWDTVSGGAGPAAIPTSLDAVNFDSLSNATAYTATIDAGVTLARCASFTMAGPLSGNVTFAGTVPIAFHGNVSFAATGITRLYIGAMNWAGNSSYTFTTNGLTLVSACTVIGVGATWTLGSALNISSSTITITCGSLALSTYNVTAGILSSSNSNVRTITLGSSTVTLGSVAPITFTTATNLTFNAGTSTISTTNNGPTFDGGGVIFYNVTSAAISIGGAFTLNQSNTFNNLTITPPSSTGIGQLFLGGNQTINGTLTVAGATAIRRLFVLSNTLGTTRTLTVGALSAQDCDFRDITIAGAAAPASGTRIGDCKGNSGITFTAAKTVYWNLAGSNNWSATGWAASSGAAPAVNNFPLAQDTCIFEAGSPGTGTTTTIDAAWNIGTIDMSARTANTMTLATGSTIPQIYGNWINGTGTTLTGTGIMTFAGRTTQQITSAGKTFTQPLIINTPGGSVTLQDAYNNSAAGAPLTLTAGTFDASMYNVTALSFIGSGTTTRTVAIGSGMWTLSLSAIPWSCATSTNLTVTGTGTISLTGASAKTFAGGSISYSGITLDQGGAGALTITGDNTFKNITNSYSATGATNITLGTTTQTLTNPWTATGAVGKVLTVQGTSASSPGTLIFSGAGTGANVDYLAITGVRAYSLATTWYAGANSTNNGSLGWYFEAPSAGISVSISETSTASDAVAAFLTFLSSASETATATDSVSSNADFNSSLSETATATDALASTLTLLAQVADAATGTDTVSVQMVFSSSLLDTATGTDSLAGILTTNNTVSETATATDTTQSAVIFIGAVSETATASDLISSLTDFLAQVSENANITDVTLVAPSVFGPQVQEAVTALDLISTIGTFNVQLVESATALDSVIGAYLWNLIDDSQDPNWVTISNPQNPGWTGIDDNQNPNWQNISNI